MNDVVYVNDHDHLLFFTTEVGGLAGTAWWQGGLLARGARGQEGRQDRNTCCSSPTAAHLMSNPHATCSSPTHPLPPSAGPGLLAARV